MAQDPKRPIDWHVISDTVLQHGERSIIEMILRVAKYEMDKEFVSPIQYAPAEPFIDLKPEDYTVADAPKELHGIQDVDAPGSDKKDKESS